MEKELTISLDIRRKLIIYEDVDFKAWEEADEQQRKSCVRNAIKVAFEENGALDEMIDYLLDNNKVKLNFSPDESI